MRTKLVSQFLFITLLLMSFGAGAQNYIARDNFQKGEIELHLGDFKEAIKYYNKAIAYHKTYTDAYFSRGKIHFLLEQREAAFDDFHKAKELDSAYHKAWFYIGMLYFRAKDYELANEYFTKTLEINPMYAIAYNYRAEAYKELGLTTPSIEDYTKAIQLEPKQVALYFGRGKCYMMQENYTEAARDFGKAIQIEPRKTIYYRYRLEANFLVGNYASTAEDIDRLIQMNPQEVDLHYHTLNAFCKAEVKNYQGAVEAIDQAISTNVMNNDFYAERAEYNLKQEKYQEALSDYQQAITLSHEEPAYYQKCGNIYFHIKDYPNTIKYSSSAIQYNPSDAEMWYIRGIAHLNLGAKKEAKSDFIKAAELGFPAKKMEKNAFKYAKSVYRKKNK